MNEMAAGGVQFHCSCRCFLGDKCRDIPVKCLPVAYVSLGRMSSTRDLAEPRERRMPVHPGRLHDSGGGEFRSGMRRTSVALEPATTMRELGILSGGSQRQN